MSLCASDECQQEYQTFSDVIMLSEESPWLCDTSRVAQANTLGCVFILMSASKEVALNWK